MNGKNQSQSRQDREELLVTSSTSSSSSTNLVERGTVSTPSSSPTTTTRITDPSLIAASIIGAPTSSIGGSICQIVTSSTGNNSNSASNLDGDDDDDRDAVTIADAELNLIEVNLLSSVSDDSSKIPAASTPEMGGPSSNNDGETCVALPSSSSYLEQRNDSNKNMLLTTRNAESDSKIESSVPTVSNVVSAPTTRSRRKLLNSEAAGTTALGHNHSISLNNSKCISLEVKNHQATKKKSTATASSINSLSHNNDLPKMAAPSIGGKNLGTLKNSDDSNVAGSSSSKRNCLVANEDESTESQSDRDETGNCSVDVNVDGIAADNRKVEPLKINLNRDIVKTKITIKPIVKPPGADSEHHVPKLTIKSSTSSACTESKSTLNCVDQQQQIHHEPHIVPKLTIRSSDCNSSNSTNSDGKHSVVPKLTIKMEGSMNCVNELNDSSSSSPSSSPTQPPLPKLTIKTTGDLTESTITSCVSSSSLLASLSPSSSTKPTVPKLTIKAIPKSSSSSSTSSNNDESFPKFTISTVTSLAPSQSSPSRLTAITDHTDVAAEGAHTNSPIPKLTIKTVQEPESSSTNQTVPRLKIRTKPDQEALSNESHIITTSPTIPKFTIKSVQENDQSIPKLTISVNDRVEACSSSSSPSSSSNEAVPKLTAVCHTEQSDGDRVPKLTISLQESPKVKNLQSQDSEIAEKHEKLPKLTIKTISEHDMDGSDKVPRLTIKTVSSIESESTEKVPKLTIKTVSEQSSEATEKIPKLTIKTVPEQESEKSDKLPKLTMKTMSDDNADKIPKLTILPTAQSEEESQKPEKIPKLTIRTVPSDQESEAVFKSEKIQKLTIKSAVESENLDKVTKITIKSIPDHNEPDKIPKLTIKTIVEDADVEKIPKLRIKSDSDESIEQIPKLTIKQITDPDSKEKVPKLTIRHIQESEENERTTLVVSTVIEQFDNCGRIPKLTIKPIPETDDVDKSSKLSVEDNNKIPKFKIKNIADFSMTNTSGNSSTDKLPKLTIKPITGTDTDEPVEKKSKLVVHQSTTNCEYSEKVPKLTIKQITNNLDEQPSVSSGSTTKVPKLIINNHTIRPGRHLKRLKTNEPLGAQINNDIKITLTQNKTLKKDSAMEGSSKKSKNDPGDAADSTAMEIDQELSAAEVSIAIDDDTKSNSKNDIVEKIEHNSIEDANSAQAKSDRAKARTILESTKATSSIDRELEIISSQSNAASHRKMSTTSQRSNMEIDGDLSDDAINDLVDILNDELNASEGLKRAPTNNTTGRNSFQSESSKQLTETISSNDRNRENVRSGNTNILVDTISLDSDEDDIVDQLAELLNENDDMDDIAEQILQDSKNIMNDSKNEEITSESAPRTAKGTELGKTDEKELIVVENDTPSSLDQDSSSISKDNATELQFLVKEKKRFVVTNANSPNYSSDGRGHSHSDMIYNNRQKDNNQPSDNSESSVLHSLLSRKIVRSDQPLSGSDSSNTRNLRATKNTLDSELNRGNTELAEVDMKSICTEDIAGVVQDNLAANSLETKPKLKRAINDASVFHLTPKRLRSDLLDNVANQLNHENSLESEIMVVQGNNCPSSVVNKTPSNIADLENSLLTGDETFHTLTELKTINNVLDENDEGSMSSSKEPDDNNINLKGILARLQNQHSDNSQTSQQSFKSNRNKENHKSSEPEISVVLSTPPHSNSLKSSQNILLINEESGSDCMVVEEDPLMILQNSIDALANKKNHNENESDLDTSRSFQTVSESTEIATPPVKRPRGRPRKDGQPAGSVKKKEDLAAKRKFKGVLMGSHNSMVERNKVLPPIDPTILVTPPINAASIPLFEKQESTTAVKSPEFPSSNSITSVTPPKTGGRRGRGGGRGRGRGAGRIARTRCVGGLSHTPEKKKDGEFFTPDRRKKPEIKTPALQVFEEDTRMSADCFTTPVRQAEIVNNMNPDENTQSSVLSISSVLDGSSNTATAPTTEKKRRAKMEVFAPEGKTEYTVDMIAEYDWPPPKGCCPARNRDTFMIQEQIAQYLGIKSFKRKYPDLPRRQVDMEERNYLQEKGLVTEKMCDLGITAVWASDVLDIMYSDFYEKYEEYKTYLREKQLRDIEAKQKALAAEAVDKSLQARERALESASKWNCNFNKARKEDRRLCLDLQNLVINLPAAVSQKLSRPIETPNFRQSSDYPIALVPGQFAENYRIYSARELRCYPINTILDPFDDRLRPKVEHNDDEDGVSSEESDCDTDSESSSEGSGSDTSSSSDSDSDTNASSEDDEDNDEDDKLPPDSNKNKCFVCHQPQNKNLNGFPEVFICCVTCRKRTHPSCIDMPTRMVTRVRNYNWQCADCKCCIKCKRKQDESKMLYCEQCDRGFHIYCIQIKTVPDGRWHCERCAICMRCGSTKAEGNLPPPPLQPNQKPSRKKAKWVHEYRVDHITKLREHSSILCVPCARLKTKQRTTS